MVCNICLNIIINHIGDADTPSSIVYGIFQYSIIYELNINRIQVYRIGGALLNMINPEVCNNMLDKVNGPENLIGSIWKIWDPVLKNENTTNEIIEDLIVNTVALFAWYHPNFLVKGKGLLKGVPAEMPIADIVEKLIKSINHDLTVSNDDMIDKALSVIEKQIVRDPTTFRNCVSELLKLLVTAYFNEVISTARNGELSNRPHPCFPVQKLWTFEFGKKSPRPTVKEPNPLFSALQDHQHIVVDGSCVSCDEPIKGALNLREYKLLVQTMMTLSNVCESGMAHAFSEDDVCHYCDMSLPVYKNVAGLIKANRIVFRYEATYGSEPPQPIDPIKAVAPKFSMMQQSESVFLSTYIAHHKDACYFNMGAPKPFEIINVVKKFLKWFMLNLREELEAGSLFGDIDDVWRSMCQIQMSQTREWDLHYQKCVTIFISICYRLNALNICANKKLNITKMLTHPMEYIHLGGEDKMHGISPLNLKNSDIEMGDDSDLNVELLSSGDDVQSQRFDGERMIDENFDGVVPELTDMVEEEEPNSDFEEFDDSQFIEEP